MSKSAASEHDDGLGAASNVLRAQARALEQVAAQLGPAFLGVLDLLRSCEGRVVISGAGRSGLVAQCMASTLSQAGVPSLFLHAADAAHGDLGMVTRADVAIFVSHGGATEELVALLPYFDELRVPIVAIVGRRASPLALAARLVLCTDTIRPGSSNQDADSISLLVSLALADALAAAL